MKDETREAIKFCARLYALLPELREEYINHKPEWHDEKALNEVLCWMVQAIEK